MKAFTRTRLLFVVSLVLCSLAGAPPANAEPRWSAEQANAWYRKTGWLVGCNYAPATAINQLEMWQADTFDLATIDRELGWAESLGFNSIRVFLHDQLWEQDPKGFIRRMERFLKVADKHGIGVMFVLFDSVWDPNPKLGTQRAPRPHVHNSGWVQSPGAAVLRDPARHDSLKGYVQGVLRRFRKDKRIHAWDLINEPDNTNGNSYGAQEPANKPELSFALLKKVYAWAREVDPRQPLTSGVWLGDWSSPEKMSPLDRYQVEEADIITFHNYGDLQEMTRRVQWLRRYGRPVLCTEYMARPMRSTFESILPFLKRENVGAYNWGFVSGKSQTIYPWDSWQKQYTGEPPVWFHDIFRTDGTPYREDEVKLIRQVTGKAAARARPLPPRLRVPVLAER